MSVAACPRCHDEVTLPSGTPPEAIVQCPLCREEFEMADVFKGMPPALLVIQMPKSAAADTPAPMAAPSGDFAFEPSDDDGEEYQFAAEPDSSDDSPGFAFDSDSSAPSAATSVGRGSISARPRAKKKAANPIKEIVKVVGGGVAGIVIAIVLIWYLPWGRAQDFLGIGPTISKIPVIGGIVPEKFRGGSQNNDSANSDNDSEPDPIFRVNNGSDGGPKGSIADFAPKNEGNGNNAPRNRNNRGGNNRGNGANAAPANEPEDLGSGFDIDLAGEEEDPLGMSNDPLGAPSVDLVDIDPTGGLDPLASVEPPADQPPAAEPPAAEPQPGVDSLEDPDPAATVDSGSNASAGNAPGGAPLGPKEKLEVSVSDLRARAEAVNESVVEYAGSAGLEATERKAISQKHYNDYAKLAAAVTAIDANDPEAKAELQVATQLLQDLGAAPEKASIMQYFASVALSNPSEAEKGILMVGKVTSVGAKGRLFYSMVDIDSSGTTPRNFVVVFGENPMDKVPEFKPGSKVVLLGRLIADPAENLRGYQGSQPVAVWAGHFVVLDNDA